MSDSFDCVYNPRRKLCLKLPGSGKSDPQCNIVGQGCRLNGDKPTETQPENPLTMLSGPVSAYAGEYQGKRYYFFGDAHFGTGGKCPSPCNDYDVDTMRPINTTEPCYDITRLLTKIFSQNNMSDFYLEIPFLPTGTAFPSKQSVANKLEVLGYIYKLYYIFYECFIKQGCPHDNARFHYVDMRLQYKPRDIQSISAFPYMETWQTKPITLENHVLGDRIKQSLLQLSLSIDLGIHERNAYIEDTDVLVQNLYRSGYYVASEKFDSLNVRLFNLYLSSDDFINDVRALLAPVISEIRDSETLSDIRDILFATKLITSRNNKRQHRIRAQLHALELEGQGELSKYIKEFIMKEYKSRIDNSQVLAIWDQFIPTYWTMVGVSSGRRTATLSDLRVTINDLSSKFEKYATAATIAVGSDALLMDVYTLARMFRTFPGTNHVDSSRVIAYAGDAHIETYVRFFESLGTKFTKYEPGVDLTRVSESSISRCLKVDLDLFS